MMGVAQGKLFAIKNNAEGISARDPFTFFGNN
jgi:hypothetical protein